MSEKLFVDVFEENANRPLPIRREYGAGAGGACGCVSYSYEEQDTGLTWVDGKKVYQCVVPVNRPTTENEWEATMHNIPNIDRVVEANAFFYRASSGGLYPVPYLRPQADSTFTHVLTCSASPRNVNLLTAGTGLVNSPEFEYYAILRYTCTDR